MKRHCEGFQEGIADLAEGKRSIAASEHVEQCADCQLRLSQLSKLIQGASLSMWAAPANLIAAAQNLMPTRQIKFSFPKLVTLGLGARSGRSGVQATYEHGEFNIRLICQKSDEGWEVTGRAPEGYLYVEHGGQTTPIEPEGYFSLTVLTPGETDIRLLGDGEELLLPSFEVPVDGSGSA